MRPLDIGGLRFDRLVAIHRAQNEGEKTTWLFVCDCGAEKVLRTGPN
jgi:hypothetical protein